MTTWRSRPSAIQAVRERPPAATTNVTRDGTTLRRIGPRCAGSMSDMGPPPDGVYAAPVRAAAHPLRGDSLFEQHLVVVKVSVGAHEPESGPDEGPLRRDVVRGGVGDPPHYSMAGGPRQ